MDHGEIFTIRLVTVVIVAIGFAVWWSWKTKNPVVALISSFAVVALVFGGLIIGGTYWPSAQPRDGIVDPFGHTYPTSTEDRDSLVTAPNIRLSFNLFSLVAYLFLLCWSWWRLGHEGIRSRRGWRMVSGFLALTLTTVSALLFIAAEILAVDIGIFRGTAYFVKYGFDGPSMTLGVLLAVGWSISMAAVILAIASRGWRRLNSLILSAANIFLWVTIVVYGACTSGTVMPTNTR